jgi:hypothetical protein
LSEDKFEGVSIVARAVMILEGAMMKASRDKVTGWSSWKRPEDIRGWFKYF